jgi:3-hydroxybutyryl-CoA dehydrogenase
MVRFTQNSIIGICGGGAMGAGIAQVASQAGHQVVVYDNFEGSLERGKSYVAKGAAALLKRKKIDEANAKAIQSRIEWTGSIEDLKHSDLIIEAIIENAEIKQKLFLELETVVGPDCILATNTSSLSVASLASRLSRPQNFIGLHFFNPAPIMKLVEVIAGAAAKPDSVSAALSLMQDWGKQAVIAKDVPGFIVNRIARPFYAEGWRAYEEGAASAEVIDFLYRDLAGFRMGPLELGDLIGHDINSKAAISIFENYYGQTRFVPSLAQAQLAQSGHLGRKSGQGIYNYENDQNPAENITFEEITEVSNIICGPKLGRVFASLNIATVNASLPEGFLSVDDVLVGFSKGQSAAAMSQDVSADVAILDWISHAKGSTAIAYSQSGERAGAAARGLIGALEKKAVRINDRSGAVVFRTILQLVNAASDGLRDKIATEDAIDTAMKYGVNYPFGPLAWARQYGLKNCVAALEKIADETGQAQLYKPNETLRQLAWSE